MAPHSRTLAWKIPWMEEPGGLQSKGSLRVGHDWVTSLSLSCIGEGNGNPLQCSCLENPRDGGAWWAVYGVAQSRTRLQRLSSSSSSSKRGLPRWLSSEESACNARDTGSIPGLGRPLEKGTATPSSIVAWEIPLSEEPGVLQSMGLQRQTLLSEWTRRGVISLCFPY